MAAGVSNYQTAIDNAVSEMESEITRLQGLVAALRGGSTKKISLNKPAAAAPAATKTTKAKRTRRSSEEVAEQAKQMVDFIKSKGKEGATGKEINAKFGTVLPSIKAFISGKTDVKIKTKGVASKTVYFA